MLHLQNVFEKKNKDEILMNVRTHLARSIKERSAVCFHVGGSPRGSAPHRFWSRNVLRSVADAEMVSWVGFVVWFRSEL